jgi:hypothetical protein
MTYAQISLACREEAGQMWDPTEWLELISIISGIN